MTLLISARSADIGYAWSQSTAGYGSLRPELLDQLFLGNQPVAVFDEVQKQPKGFRAEAARASSAPDHHATGIDLDILPDIDLPRWSQHRDRLAQGILA